MIEKSDSKQLSLATASILGQAPSPVYVSGFFTTVWLPQVPQNLAQLPCLIYSNNPNPNHWQFSGPQGNETVKINGPLEADNGDISKSASIAGLGISLLPSLSSVQSFAAEN